MFNYMIKQIDACKIIIVFIFNYVWFEPRVPTAQLGHWPRASDRLGPAHVSWARPNPKKRKKKESGSDLGFRPSRPKLYLLKVCVAKHTLMYLP